MYTDRNRGIDKENGVAGLDDEAEKAALSEISGRLPKVASVDVFTGDSEDLPLAAHMRVKNQSHNQGIERDFERERQLADFKRDRDFILLSIQGALKARHYKEAQEIVFQYRLAAEMDSKFRRLAQLTKAACLERGVVDDLLFILDATPDDDHVKRYALYERLLQVEPNTQSYKDGYELARQALNLEQRQGSKTRLKIGQMPHALIVFEVVFAVIMFLLLLALFL